MEQKNIDECYNQLIEKQYFINGWLVGFTKEPKTYAGKMVIKNSQSLNYFVSDYILTNSGGPNRIKVKLDYGNKEVKVDNTDLLPPFVFEKAEDGFTHFLFDDFLHLLETDRLSVEES